MRRWPAIDVSGLDTRTADVVSGFPGRRSAEREGGSRTSDALQAALTDYDVAAIDETSDTAWRVFFHANATRDRALEAMRTAFPALSFDAVDVADEDWAARSQANLRAIQVGRVIVAPPWDVPVTIVIQPSMGFGTAHHPTTRLCLSALQRLTLDGRRVLDIGTGSGVLAIAASKLGAAEVTGIDDDADAIHAAWENLALNTGAMVSLIVGDFRSVELVPADLILANLTGELLLATAKRQRQLTNAHGRLILSGFLAHEEPEVRAAFAAFAVEHREEEEGWVCITVGEPS